MYKEEDIVPSPELCQKIPEGSFSDSVFVWAARFCESCCLSANKVVMLRAYAENSDKHRILSPAPTLAEIFALLPQTAAVSWFVQDEYPNVFAVCCYVLQPRPLKPKRICEIDANPATAAMKLWLQMEGVK